ncbi:MAG: hypothetical protein BWX59_02526 [Bacteroidetes bacterium ADurb.Bin028]|jgi:hypothetical protein|nr:MAG: hypothetical protein BWX59_02526 [Bacteroidetes bacterium ADurb.Bin028]
MQIHSYSETAKISNGAKEILKKLVENERLSLEKIIPLKVHFGEKEILLSSNQKTLKG